MKCEICGTGMKEGATLHRVNEIGVTGVWRCFKCMTPAQRETIDPQVLDIVTIIENRNESK